MIATSPTSWLKGVGLGALDEAAVEVQGSGGAGADLAALSAYRSSKRRGLSGAVGHVEIEVPAELVGNGRYGVAACRVRREIVMQMPTDRARFDTACEIASKSGLACDVDIRRPGFLQECEHARQADRSLHAGTPRRRR